MTKPKYTQQELEQLYAIALRDGWDQLEQSERLAVDGTAGNTACSAPASRRA